MSGLSRLLPKFLRRPADGSECKIILLDDTEFILPYRDELKGEYLVNKVFEKLSLWETACFGLRFSDKNGQKHWLDVEKTLSSQFKSCSLPYTLYFGVKFYPANPCKLTDETTRYQVFLQVRRDLRLGLLKVTLEEAAELSAYAVQSDYGDFDTQGPPTGYVSKFKFVPNQTKQLEDQIETMHQTLRGTDPATAESKFLDRAKELEMYGVKPHPLKEGGNTDDFLGLTANGVVVYRNDLKEHTYLWAEITKIDYTSEEFIIKVQNESTDESTNSFKLHSKEDWRHKAGSYGDGLRFWVVEIKVHVSLYGAKDVQVMISTCNLSHKFIIKRVVYTSGQYNHGR